MRRFHFAIAGVVVLSIVLFSTISSSLASTMPPSSSSTSTPSAVNVASSASIPEVVDQQDPVFKNLNVDITEINESVKLDKQTAIEKAKQGFNTNFTQKAKVNAFLVRFTDKNLKQLSNGRSINPNTPAWLVRFNGITLEHRGRVLHEFNVVIDANTGEEIETFSYR